MPVLRSDAVTRLVGKYGTGAYNLLDQADVGKTDIVGGLKEPIDSAALAVLGDWDQVGAASVETSSVGAYFAALDYFTLERLILGLNRKADLDVAVGEGVSVKGSQLIAKLVDLQEKAGARCSGLGVDVVGSVAFVEVPAGGFRFSLDYLEPTGEMEL